MSEDIWDGKTVFIKGFWGWSPETWATIAFTNEASRKRMLSNSTDPFLVAIYVTESSPLPTSQSMRGKIVGFYEMSHEIGTRNELTHPIRHDWETEKWQHGIRAIKAFDFLPEFQPRVYEFDPSLKSGAQGKASRGVILEPDQIEVLKEIPFVETPIYVPSSNSSLATSNHVFVPRGKVRGGPANRSGYTVDGEPKDTQKELYALVLKGGTEYFLDHTRADHKVYKIGLSISPMIRAKNFEKSLPKSFPEGKITWSLHRSTSIDKHPPYPDFEAALAGENAMKNYLAKVALHLGGEFYAATDEQFETAWIAGREAALKA